MGLVDRMDEGFVLMFVRMVKAIRRNNGVVKKALLLAQMSIA